MRPPVNRPELWFAIVAARIRLAHLRGERYSLVDTVLGPPGEATEECSHAVLAAMREAIEGTGGRDLLDLLNRTRELLGAGKGFLDDTSPAPCPAAPTPTPTHAPSGSAPQEPQP